MNRFPVGIQVRHPISRPAESAVIGFRHGQSLDAWKAYQTGVRLEELNTWIGDTHPELFYPIDPTEMSASVGGTISTDASGPRSLAYGSTRDWVQSITVVLIDGRAITEASGGINAGSVRAVAEAGVDYISSGAITHSAPSLDLGLDFETLG